MSIEVMVESAEWETEVFSLLDALNSEDEDAAVLKSGEREPGALGGMVQSVELVAASGALAKVLIAWLRTRPSTTRLTLKNKEGESVQINHTGTSADEPAQLLREVIAFFERSKADDRK